MRLIAVTQPTKVTSSKLHGKATSTVARWVESIRTEHRISSLADDYYGIVFWANLMDSPFFLLVIDDKREGKMSQFKNHPGAKVGVIQIVH